MTTPRQGDGRAYAAAGCGGSGGFTFLEILCVVFIVGLMASLVVINIDRSADDLALAEARRFRELVNHASDESAIRGYPLGIRVDAETPGYRFYRFTGQWSEVADDPLFRQRSVPEAIRLSIDTPTGSAREATGEDDEEGDDPADGRAPDILLEPGGGVSVYSVAFATGDRVWSVRPDASNRAVVLAHEKRNGGN